MKILKMLSLAAAAAALTFTVQAVLAASFKPGTLLKGTGPAVYYISADGKAHVFINQAIFNSWYPKGAKIIKISDSALFKIPKGANMPPVTSNSSSDGWMSADQKRRAEQITSVFESGTPEFDYAVCVNLDDGRGYTCGRIGFTTATGDAYLAAKRYTDMAPNNPLAQYVSRVKKLYDNEDPSVSGLVGFTQAWALAAKDPAFRFIQDWISDQVYYIPAMRAADKLGVKAPLIKAALYDTMVQHGGGDSPDSFDAIVQRANRAAGGMPRDGLNERNWFNQFLKARKADLLFANNAETRKAWAESAGRVDALRSIADSNNYELRPFDLNSAGYRGFIQ